jgi:two-component system nitrogen regulation response regulator GlnG
VRELQSVLRQALLRASGPVLLAAFLPKALGETEHGQPTSPAAAVPADAFLIRQRIASDVRDMYAEAHRKLDRLLLPRVLEHTRSQQQAAFLLGIARQTLRLKLRNLGELAPRTPESEDERPERGGDGAG